MDTAMNGFGRDSRDIARRVTQPVARACECPTVQVFIGGIVAAVVTGLAFYYFRKV